MKRRFAGTGIAIAVLLLLGAYLYIRSISQGSGGDAVDTHTIFDFDQPLSTITISNEHGTFTFERGADDRWRIIEPQRLPAEERRINAMRSALRRLTAVNVVWAEATGADRTKVGLGSNATRVTFQHENSQENYTLEIGDLHPRGDEFYVARADRPAVYTVRKWTLEVFEHDLEEYRRRRVLELDRAQATRVDIYVGKEHKLGFQRETGETPTPWRFNHPMTARADQDLVETLVSKVANLRAETFVADAVSDFAPYGLDEPAWRIVVSTADGKHELLGGNVAGGSEAAFPSYYVRSADLASVYTTASPVRRDVSLPISEWRDDMLMRFDVGLVRKIVIAGASESVSAARDDAQETWRMEDEAARYANAQVMALLRTLLDVRARDYVDDAPPSLQRYGLETPSTSVTLTFADGSQVSFDVGGRTGSRRYAKTSDFPGVYTIDASAVLAKTAALRELSETS